MGPNFSQPGVNLITSTDPLLVQIVADLCRDHGCHTVILYGSRARGDFTATSDYDILGVRPKGEAERDARLWQGVYLDIFVFPEAKLQAPDESLIYMLGGKVLVEKDTIGSDFLGKLQQIFAHGPRALPADEARAKRVWAQKMLDRAKVDDLEGNYRRHWLVMSMLEDYFVLRGRWYQGPKSAFQWLRQHDQEAANAFAMAMRAHAMIADLEALVQVVVCHD